MKKIILSLTAVALLAGCNATGPLNPIVNTGIIGGVSTALSFVPAAKRATVANYVDVAATALRAVTGTPNAAQLTALVSSYIPASVKASFPEVLPLITTAVVAEYTALYNKYASTGNTAAIAAGLNSIAVDLEAGAAPYITKG